MSRLLLLRSRAAGLAIAGLLSGGVLVYLLVAPRRDDGREEPVGAETGRQPARDLGPLRELAIAHSSQGNRAAAFEAVDGLLSGMRFGRAEFWKQPDAGGSLRIAMQVARRFYDYRRLEGLASAMVEQYPDDVEGWMLLGLAERHIGEYSLAEKHLTRCLHLGCGSPSIRDEVRLELSLALAKQNRHRAALEELTRLLVDNPYSRKGYLRLGKCLSRLGKPDMARRMFELSLSLAPGDGEDERAADFLSSGRHSLAARYRARAFSLRGQFAEAEKALRDALSEEVEGASVYLAEFLVDTLQAHKAIEVLRGLSARVGPAHPDVRGWTAMALELQGRSEAAADILSSLLNGQPRLIPIWAPRLARILLEDLSAPRAARAWLEVYRKGRPSVETGILLARALLQCGDVEEAVATLESLPPTDPGWQRASGDLWLALSRLRARQDVDEAGKLLSGLAESHRHVPDYHRALAEWLERRGGADPETAGRIREARREVERLASLEAERRRLVRESSRSRGEKAPSFLCDAAEICHRMGDRDGAIRLARIAASSSEGYARPWALLSRWLDAPEEAFLRTEARRESGAPNPDSDRSPDVSRIVEFLAPRGDSRPSRAKVESTKRPSRTSRVLFVDASETSGVDFVHVGGSKEKDWILEINGGGVALLDYDLDGRLDIFLVNGSRLPPPYGDGPGVPPPSDALYRNLGGFRFEDVTARAGLVEYAWGCGVAFGDYDNDGDPDIYVTNYGPDRMWRNEGDGTFTDATSSTGTDDPRWGSSCGFLDFDRDGFLDLFVVNYLDFDAAVVKRRGRDPSCHYRGVPIACGPGGLRPTPCTLYRNLGGGTFADISERAGIRAMDIEHFTYGLGVAVIDADVDGWLDIYVANDTRPNLLFRNRRDGTFEEVAMRGGVAFNDAGMAQAGMGVDSVFLGESALEDLFVVNFEDDGNTYYRNEGAGSFSEVSAELGLTAPSFQYLGWGTFFFDADLDGDLDLFVANGHVAPQVEQFPSSAGYRQRNQFYQNDGNGKFNDVSDRAGPGFLVTKTSRGAAFGDLDGDGDLDIVINELDDRVTILENAGDHENNWLAVRAVGTRSSRDGIGSVVSLETPLGTQRWRIRSGSSYASQSESVARFGLGRERQVRQLRVLWSAGGEEVFEVSGVNRLIEVVEGKGREL